jgi:hypothetical protein
MSIEEIGVRFCNLLLPGDAQHFVFTAPAGDWEFDREPDYERHKEAIRNKGACGGTYSARRLVDTSNGRSAALELALDEMLPISLGASYLAGMTVSPFQDLPFSAIKFIQYGDHYPRPRAMGDGSPMFITLDEFLDDLGPFVRAYPALEQSHNARLLIHHWLDALAFWSLEDLTLSTATILEIISATGQRLGGPNVDTFNKGLDYAASQNGLTQLSRDFRHMRNDLVHEGHLSGSNFPNKDLIECANAAASALDWIDRYICKVFGLGAPRRTRFGRNTFINVNAFSLD